VKGELEKAKDSTQQFAGCSWIW